MYNADYSRQAHLCATWKAVHRLLRDRHLDEDSTPKEKILCEEAFYADREVSQDAIMQVLHQLQLQIDDAYRRLRVYELSMRQVDEKVAEEKGLQKDAAGSANDGKPREESNSPGRKSGRPRKRSGPTGEGLGQ